METGNNDYTIAYSSRNLFITIDNVVPRLNYNIKVLTISARTYDNGSKGRTR